MINKSSLRGFPMKAIFIGTVILLWIGLVGAPIVEELFSRLEQTEVPEQWTIRKCYFMEFGTTEYGICEDGYKFRLIRLEDQGDLTYDEMDDVTDEGRGLSDYWHPNVARWEHKILSIAPAFQVDPDLVAAIMTIESMGNPDAVSHSGAIGLMQVMPKEEGYTSRPSRVELFDPATNITWGLRILAAELEWAGGDVALALGAYYDGRADAKARTPRTLGYATLVLGEYEASKES